MINISVKMDNPEEMEEFLREIVGRLGKDAIKAIVVETLEELNQNKTKQIEAEVFTPLPLDDAPPLFRLIDEGLDSDSSKKDPPPFPRNTTERDHRGWLLKGAAVSGVNEDGVPRNAYFAEYGRDEEDEWPVNPDGEEWPDSRWGSCTEYAAFMGTPLVGYKKNSNKYPLANHEGRMIREMVERMNRWDEIQAYISQNGEWRHDGDRPQNAYPGDILRKWYHDFLRRRRLGEC